jgi:predicted small metal-binding protein
MKTLACKDMGVECDFVAKAETTEETMKMATEHAMTTHKDKMDEMAKMMPADEMNAMMMAHVKDEM